MKTYCGAIFDLDGTLLDTIADIGNSANLVLASHGFPTHETAAYQQFVGRGFLNLLRQACPAGTSEETCKELLAELLTVYAEHYMEQTVPYPGMVELVYDLHKAGIPVAVNSNKRHPYTQALIAKHFPDIAFTDVIGEGADYPAKPDPTAALTIAAKMGLKPDQVLYIGDSNTDMQTGHNAGMDTVGCVWGFRGAKELAENHATHLVETAEEIRKLF